MIIKVMVIALAVALKENEGGESDSGSNSTGLINPTLHCLLTSLIYKQLHTDGQ